MHLTVGHCHFLLHCIIDLIFHNFFFYSYRFSGFYFLAFILFMAVYGWQIIRFGLGFSRLVAMSHFYGQLLNIPDVSHESGYKFSDLSIILTPFFIGRRAIDSLARSCHSPFTSTTNVSYHFHVFFTTR